VTTLNQDLTHNWIATILTLLRFRTRKGLKRKPRKSLTYKALLNEAEGTRTLNLRIDSPDAKTPKDREAKNLGLPEKVVYTNLSQDNSEISKELAKIIDAWPSIPEHVKQTIRTLAAVTAKEKSQ